MISVYLITGINKSPNQNESLNDIQTLISHIGFSWSIWNSVAPIPRKVEVLHIFYAKCQYILKDHRGSHRTWQYAHSKRGAEQMCIWNPKPSVQLPLRILQQSAQQLLRPMSFLQAPEVFCLDEEIFSLFHFHEIKWKIKRRKIKAKPKLSIFISLLVIYMAMYLIFLPLLGTGSNCYAIPVSNDRTNRHSHTRQRFVVFSCCRGMCWSGYTSCVSKHFRQL